MLLIRILSDREKCLPLPPAPSERGPLMEITGKKTLLLPPPPTESGGPQEITENVPGDIGRVAPPQTKILATPLVAQL